MTIAETWESLSRPKKAILYCITYIDELRDAGLVSGGLSLAFKGNVLSEAMKESGFKPEPHEIARAMNAILRHE